jgi:hypothetical protein
VDAGEGYGGKKDLLRTMFLCMPGQHVLLLQCGDN